jgi:putative membrane protein
MEPSRLVRGTEVLAALLCLVSLGNVAAAMSGKGVPPAVVQVTVWSILALTLCIVHAGLTKGWRRALGFSALSFVISWAVEFVGCNYGWWFGDYGYSEVLGIALGNVPILVVVSWEIIIYPSLLLVDRFTGGVARTGFARVMQLAFASLATGLIATTWDTMTDPISVHAGYWAWDHGGEYAKDLAGGIPYSNFWGWIGAVFLISFLYRLLGDRSPLPPTASAASPWFATWLFTSLFLGSLANLFTFGFHTIAFIGCFTMGPIVVMAWTMALAARRS